MKIEKRPLTLIEVCIAFGIIAVCFFIVFSNFSSSSKLLAKSESARISSMQRQYFSERLTYLFEHLEKGSLSIDEKRVDDRAISFLSFVYENGLDREMIFSGKRRGEIELNQNDELILTTFSKDGDQSRQEILHPHVKEVNWNLETTAAVRVTIKDDEDKEIDFAFLLSRGKEEVIVLEEGL